MKTAPPNDVGAPFKDGAEADPAITSAIRAILENFDVQPVLFIGAGIARRYIGAPDWDGALQAALSKLSERAPPYSYFVQKYGDDKVAIGTAIGDLLFEWAWDKGRDQFPTELYSSSDRYVFIKWLIAQILIERTPAKIDEIDQAFRAELIALSKVRPHALITTNYDSFLEILFDGYEPIVGRGVLRYDLNSFGEVFHVHGSVADPASMVLTEPDYRNWQKQSCYFAAKLLTYFVEHPVFIFGYGLGDPNVRTLLQDIGRIVADEDGLIGNVAQVVWHATLKSGPFQSEVVIDDEDDGRQYRLKVFNVSSLIEVYALLAANHELKQVNPALLRSLAARLMKLTRKDIPGGTVEVDYATLEKVAADDDLLPKMLGLTFADTDNKTHPFTLSQVADELGLAGWNSLNPIIKKIKDEIGVDLRSYDNRYHERIKTGKKETSAVRKWSVEAVDLFKDIMDGKAYEVKE